MGASFSEFVPAPYHSLSARDFLPLLEEFEVAENILICSDEHLFMCLWATNIPFVSCQLIFDFPSRILFFGVLGFQSLFPIRDEKQ